MTPADLEALRKSMGLTVRKFAAHLGIAERTYRHWKSKSFKPRRLARERIELVRFCDGKQWTDEELKTLKSADKPPLMPNMIRREAK